MFTFNSYESIPETYKEYILTVCGEIDIYELTLSEINGYLNGLMSWYDEMQED